MGDCGCCSRWGSYMKKTQKIDILNGFIERSSKLEYRANKSPKAIITDVLSFVRNTLEKINASAWEKRINEIRWSPDIRSCNYEEAWLSGKKELGDILKSIKREIEFYTPDDEEQIESNKNGNNPIIFLSHSSSDKLYGGCFGKIHHWAWRKR